MIFYAYVCPECGLIVRTKEPVTDMLEVKACVCACLPVEHVEEPAV